MKWTLICTACTAIAILTCLLLWWSFPEPSKTFVDGFANHASVLGLVVGVLGFFLTIVTVVEAKIALRKDVDDLLANVKLRLLDDTREQAHASARRARDAVLSSSWRHAFEKCEDSRQYALRLLEFSEVADPERMKIRTAIDDLNTVKYFIEKNRLDKSDAPQSLPKEKLEPLDQLLDALATLATRLQRKILEAP